MTATEKINASDISRLMRLAYLSPTIVEATLLAAASSLALAACSVRPPTPPDIAAQRLVSPDFSINRNQFAGIA